MSGVKAARYWGMASYRWHESGFISEVAAHRGYRVEGNAGSGWRMHGVTGAPGGVRWTVTLTPASGETGPQIVWRTADVRAGDARRQLAVGRSSPSGTSFGAVEGGAIGLVLAAGALAVGGLLRRSRGRGRAPAPAPPEPARAEPPGASVLGPDWSVLDPSGVLDPALAPWFNAWPTAWWGPGDERPARLDRVWLSDGGLELAASDWWCSAPALDQLVGLGAEIAGRLDRAG